MGRKLKVAVFTDTFYPSVGGIESSIMTSAVEFSKRGHQLIFFAPSARRDQTVREFVQLKIEYVGAVPFFPYDSYRVALPFSSRAQRVFEEFQPDIVHCQTPFSLGWMGLNLGRKYKLPVVATYHTLLPAFLVYLPLPILNKTRMAEKLAWGYTKLFYGKADVVTTLSRTIVRELQEKGIRAAFIPSPVEFELFNKFAKTQKSEKEFRLIFFGRLSFEKNIEVVLEALKILLQKHSNVCLVIVGIGPAENFLKKKAAKMGLEQKVEFASVLRGEALARKVASCHVSVTASTIETQGLTILEGMAAGLPCIGSDCFAIPDSVKENYNGFLFPPFRAEICAQKIDALMKSEQLREKLSKNAIETARPYRAEGLCYAWETLYSKMMGVDAGELRPVV
jgi:glycosyltransferase involved in cell wall biosynthesis